MNDRVTARLFRTDDGEIHREYVVDGVGYGSLSALKTAVNNR